MGGGEAGEPRGAGGREAVGVGGGGGGQVGVQVRVRYTVGPG